MGLGRSELAKRSQRPNYAALRDFLATFLAVDPGGGECLADGGYLLIPNRGLARTGALSWFVVWANVEKCVSHNDEDTGQDDQSTRRSRLADGLKLAEPDSNDDGRTLGTSGVEGSLVTMAVLPFIRICRGNC